MFALYLFFPAKNPNYFESEANFLLTFQLDFPSDLLLAEVYDAAMSPHSFSSLNEFFQDILNWQSSTVIHFHIPKNLFYVPVARADQILKNDLIKFFFPLNFAVTI